MNQPLDPRPKSYLPPIGEAEARRMVGGDYGDAIRDRMMKLIIHFGFATPGDTTDLKLSVGTAFPVRTPTSLFLITACHVADGFLNMKKDAERFGCQIGNIPFPFEERLISRNPVHDIATFRITEEELRQIDRVPVEWPPLTPKPGWGFAWAGVPLDGRKLIGPRTYEFGACVNMTNIMSVTDSYFTCQIDHGELVIDPRAPPSPPQADMRGISGGPALVLYGTIFQTYRLCGVIIQQMAAADYFTFARADFLDQDGIVHDYPVSLTPIS